MGKYKKFKFGASSHCLGTINENFDAVGENIDDLIKEQKAIKNTDVYRDVSVLCDSEGRFLVFDAGKHPAMKLLEGYIQAADNIKQNNSIKLTYGRKERELSKASIKSTEKSGKTHALSVTKWKTINQHDQLLIKTNNRRKVIVHMRFEIIG